MLVLGSRNCCKPSCWEAKLKNALQSHLEESGIREQKADRKTFYSIVEMQVITDVWRQDYCLCSWSDCERFGALHCWKESHVILLQNSKHLVWLWLFLLASNTGSASGTYCPPQLTVCSLNSLSLFFLQSWEYRKFDFFLLCSFIYEESASTLLIQY